MTPPPNAFRFEIEVVEADIDAQGHVSNVRVLDWMNQAAIAHSEALGFDVPRYREVGGIFVVRRHEIDYLAPAYLGQRLVLHTWPCGRVRRSLAERRHHLVRAEDGQVVAQGLNQWVYVDIESGRPRTMPPEVLATFDPAQWEPAPEGGQP
ncbi:MAG: acyl-CoA thioesterase [Planctomycetota bacterium]